MLMHWWSDVLAEVAHVCQRRTWTSRRFTMIGCSLCCLHCTQPFCPVVTVYQQVEGNGNQHHALAKVTGCNSCCEGPHIPTTSTSMKYQSISIVIGSYASSFGWCLLRVCDQRCPLCHGHLPPPAQVLPSLTPHNRRRMQLYIVFEASRMCVYRSSRMRPVAWPTASPASCL